MSNPAYTQPSKSDRVNHVPSVKLNNGTNMPLFGLGTWQSEKGTVASAVRNAIQLGYRLIDCAAVYKNQEEIGHVFEECFKEEAHFKREDFFIVSKLWNTCHSKDNVKQACKKSLHDLKLSYLDLYLIHFPIAFEYGGLDLDPIIPKDDKGNIKLARVSIAETWKAMEVSRKNIFLSFF
jgi:diketogulonate reductase-like aldo/keto reductase